MLGKQLIQAAAGAAGAGGGALYVDDVFSTFLYTGTGSSRSINNGIDLTGEGGLVWIKNRDSGFQDHAIYDTERGAGQTLNSASSNGQFLSTARFSAFNSNGFTVGTDNGTNQSGNGMVSWTFRKAPKFFDVVKFTSSGAASQQIAHNLGSVPGCIIMKGLSSQGWRIYHRGNNGGSSPEDYNIAFGSNGANNSTMWNDTAPTSTHFSVGANLQGDTQSYIAYLFAHDEAAFGTDSDESIIKCGHYTPSGSNTAERVINLGFEPQWLLLKRSDGTGSWYIVDNMRGFPVSVTTNFPQLTPNNSDEEYTVNNGPAITSTGFVANDFLGGSSANVIYIAIRRPHKPPEAATEVFAMDTYGGTTPTPPLFNASFPVDLGIFKSSNSTQSWRVGSRLTSGKRLEFDNDGAESSNSSFLFDYQNGWYFGTGSIATTYSYMFKRAPGFFDAVAYTGTGSARTVDHNLEVVPELVIVKGRTNTDVWAVYAAPLGASYRIRLNMEYGTGGTQPEYWNSTTPTATLFTVGINPAVNNNSTTYISYLFATLSGISKVGSYTGTGNAINVDCGFSSGARFILIKRTDADGDWFVYDTLRGIVSGNDPYLFFNTSAAQVTNTDYIDPLSSGFTVTSSAPTGLNASGGTYIFLAIA